MTLLWILLPALATLYTVAQFAETACDRKCSSYHEVQLVRSRLDRLSRKNDIFHKLLGKKRGREEV